MQERIFRVFCAGLTALALVLAPASRAHAITVFDPTNLAQNLLQATRADAATGLLDVRRLGEMLSRIRGRIMHRNLEQISPLAVPIMLEIGKERVNGDAGESLLSEAEQMIEEAMGRP